MTKPKTTDLSKRHESEVAALLPAAVKVTASGATLDRHDVRTLQSKLMNDWTFRYELKATQRKSYSFKVEDHLEFREYSILRGERPAWCVRFYGDREVGRIADLPVKADLVCIELADWIELLSEVERLRANQQET
jgi:hypothetical protein